MKTSALFCESLLLLTSLVVFPSAMISFASGDDSNGMDDSEFLANSIALFNSETLAGWEGDAYWFRVQGDAIIAGRIDQAIPQNMFLCTTQNYDDFELRLEVKLVRDADQKKRPKTGPNAGVQFRSKRIPPQDTEGSDTEVSGYQADVGEAWGRSVWGALYDESRRKMMLAEGDPDLVKRLTKPGDWNSLRVICRGKRVQIFLNGEKTVDYTELDKDIPVYGMIGLQIHSGPATEAWYRNVRIRQFQ